MIKYIALIVSFILVGVDQLFKFWAIEYLKPVSTHAIFEDILHFTYVENTGAAFGIFSGNVIFLIIITSIAILASIFLIFYKKITSKILICSLSLVIAGGIGNLVDRIFRGYVVDYVDFRFINFAVFNLADVFVVVGCIFLIIYILFFDKKLDQNKFQGKSVDGK